MHLRGLRLGSHGISQKECRKQTCDHICTCVLIQERPHLWTVECVRPVKCHRVALLYEWSSWEAPKIQMPNRDKHLPSKRVGRGAILSRADISLQNSQGQSELKPAAGTSHLELCISPALGVSNIDANILNNIMIIKILAN